MDKINQREFLKTTSLFRVAAAVPAIAAADAPATGDDGTGDSPD